MPDIKTKGSNKGVIKTLDKAAIVTQRMKQSYIATKNKAEHSVNANTNSAEEYASEKFEGGADEIVHDGAYAFDKAGRICEARGPTFPAPGIGYRPVVRQKLSALSVLSPCQNDIWLVTLAPHCGMISLCRV